VGRQRAYPSDLTDEQWEIIEPMLPLIKEPGRIPKHPFRDIVDAILYLDRSGCSWRQRLCCVVRSGDAFGPARWRGQIAVASSVNAAATRRRGCSSVASS
jgi:hypothetical protein